jgi:hypothetical protein
MEWGTFFLHWKEESNFYPFYNEFITLQDGGCWYLPDRCKVYMLTVPLCQPILYSIMVLRRSLPLLKYIILRKN